MLVAEADAIPGVRMPGSAVLRTELALGGAATGRERGGSSAQMGVRWAAWWNHPWADSEESFDTFCTQLETRCPGYSRQSQDVDWCSESISSLRPFFFRHNATSSLGSTRSPIENWLTDLRSHSYVIDLGESEATGLITDIETLLRRTFEGAAMVVPYETRSVDSPGRMTACQGPWMNRDLP